jgi:hypothetical protein
MKLRAQPLCADLLLRYHQFADANKLLGDA